VSITIGVSDGRIPTIAAAAIQRCSWQLEIAVEVVHSGLTERPQQRTGEHIEKALIR
jgi:hypothetical protein